MWREQEATWWVGRHGVDRRKRDQRVDGARAGGNVGGLMGRGHERGGGRVDGVRAGGSMVGGYKGREQERLDRRVDWASAGGPCWAGRHPFTRMLIWQGYHNDLWMGVGGRVDRALTEGNVVGV